MMSYLQSTTSRVRGRQWMRPLSNCDGMCLSELMISLTIGAVVLATALTTLNTIQAHASKQHRTLNHQQDLRVGLEVFEQEVRLATADTIARVAPQEFLFHANLADQRTITTAEVSPGSSVLPVLDGSGWGEGKTIHVCGWNSCESHQLARAGQRHQLTLTEPIGMRLTKGASVQVRNQVKYYVKGYKDSSSSLMRMVDGGASVLIGDLSDPTFSYWNDLGQRTTDPLLVRRIMLEIHSTKPLHRMVREVSIRS